MRQEGGKTWQVGARHASVTMMHIDWGELAMPDDKSPFSPNAVHLVRTTQQINLTLSQMADQKASILMGATFSFISAMLAVFAILPSVATKPIPGGHPNILFFGTFTMMGEDEFADAVLGELKSDETIYRAMLRDIYQNGQVLQRKKYRFLGYAYRAFLAGLVLTVATLIAERLL